MSTSYRVEYWGSYGNGRILASDEGEARVEAGAIKEICRMRGVNATTRIIRVETTETVLPDAGEVKPVCPVCGGKGRVTDPISGWLAVPCPDCGKGEA